MLTEVKALLGIADDDDSRDSQLDVIITMTESRLKTLLNVKNIPSELEFIVDEVAVKRFNRIGSEGFSSHTVEGESISMGASDFDEYMPEIEAWKKAQDDEAMKPRRIKFL